MTGGSARCWWLYAFFTTRRQLAASRMRWAALARAAGLRKPYVAAYARWLGEGRPQSGVGALAAMEEQLDEGAVTRFRCGVYCVVCCVLCDVCMV